MMHRIFLSPSVGGGVSDAPIVPPVRTALPKTVIANRRTPVWQSVFPHAPHLHNTGKRIPTSLRSSE